MKHSTIATLVMLVWLSASTTYGQFGSLGMRVPNGANTLVMVNFDKLMSSPLAQEEDWRRTQENAFSAGLTMVPPTTDTFLMAAQMDLEFLQPVWEVSLARIRQVPSLPMVAAKWGGSVDIIENKDVVRMPDDSYLVKFNDTMVGGMRPANRQAVARWLRQTATTQGQQHSEYLKQAFAYADRGGTPIIMAMDLTDAISPSLIEQRLAEHEDMAELLSSVDQTKLMESLTSVRGITLGVTVNKTMTGAIKVDFDKDISALKDVAKPLLLQVLANNGAMIDEVSGWEATVENKQMRIQGQLYQSGLRRIMSVLSAPPSLQQLRAQSGTSEPTEESLAATASQAYFKQVTTLVEDLREKPNKKTTGQVGIWFGRYADKIDNLPMLHVDSELLEYGRFVSGTFRDAETVLRNVGARSRVRQVNAPAQYNTYARWGVSGRYNGYYGPTQWGVTEDLRAEGANRARIRTEERAQGASSARDLMVQVDNATSDIRRVMIEKYDVNF